MKTLSITAGILLGIFVGGAAAVLAMSHRSHQADEEAAWFMISLFVLTGGVGVTTGGVLASRLHDYFTNAKSSRISWQAKLGTIAAVLCGAPLLVVWAFHSPLNRDYPPSDASLIADFHEEKPALEKAVAGNGLMKHSGADLQGLMFDRWGSQPLYPVDGDMQTRKGYAYFVKPPKELKPSLEGLNSGTAPSIKAYRHIEGNWYLFYDHRPD